MSLFNADMNDKDTHKTGICLAFDKISGNDINLNATFVVIVDFRVTNKGDLYFTQMYTDLSTQNWFGVLETCIHYYNYSTCSNLSMSSILAHKLNIIVT